MARPFDPTDPETWGLVLGLQQMAQIYGRTPSAIRAACSPKAKYQFNPKPFQSHPYQWRKADLLRHLIAGRSVSLVRSA